MCACLFLFSCCIIFCLDYYCYPYSIWFWLQSFAPYIKYWCDHEFITHEYYLLDPRIAQTHQKSKNTPCIKIETLNKIKVYLFDPSDLILWYSVYIIVNKFFVHDPINYVPYAKSLFYQPSPFFFSKSIFFVADLIIGIWIGEFVNHYHVNIKLPGLISSYKIELLRPGDEFVIICYRIIWNDKRTKWQIWRL
jgi:hypothetical protein